MISVIIPVLNEERALPATLQRVFALHADTDGFEVIVVDGGSTDSTADIVAREPRIIWQVAETGRASQMNAGAHTASGDWLLFLHADTLLPDDALQAANANRRRHDNQHQTAKQGASDHKLDDRRTASGMRDHGNSP